MRVIIRLLIIGFEVVLDVGVILGCVGGGEWGGFWDFVYIFYCFVFICGLGFFSNLWWCYIVFSMF
jgi:hypothetical protein